MNFQLSIARGNIEDERECSFKELVSWLREFSIEPSCWPIKSGDDFWLTVDREPNYIDTFTRDDERLSVHLNNKTARTLRYWFKAYQAAM